MDIGDCQFLNNDLIKLKTHVLMNTLTRNWQLPSAIKSVQT